MISNNEFTKRIVHEKHEKKQSKEPCCGFSCFSCLSWTPFSYGSDFDGMFFLRNHLMRLYRLLSFVWNHPLNAGGKVAAVLRVIRWQLAARLLPGPIALQYVEHTQLFATLGMTGATGNWYCGGVTRLPRTVLQPAMGRLHRLSCPTRIRPHTALYEVDDWPMLQAA